jgi:hypothetical protein
MQCLSERGISFLTDTITFPHGKCAQISELSKKIGQAEQEMEGLYREYAARFA